MHLKVLLLWELRGSGSAWSNALGGLIICKCEQLYKSGGFASLLVWSIRCVATATGRNDISGDLRAAISLGRVIKPFPNSRKSIITQ